MSLLVTCELDCSADAELNQLYDAFVLPGKRWAEAVERAGELSITSNEGRLLVVLGNLVIPSHELGSVCELLDLVGTIEQLSADPITLAEVRS